MAVGTDANIIRLCDAQTGKQLATFSGHQDGIQAVTFHPSGSLLASSDMAGVIRLWPINPFRSVEQHNFGGTDKWPPYFQGHSARAWSLAFSPDGTRLISASKDGTVRSWSGREQIRQDIKGTADTNDVTFVSQGSELLIAGDKNIRIWNRQADEVRPFGETFDEYAMCVAVSPDGATCVTGHREGVIRFWSRETGRLKRTLTGHESSVNHIAFSPDGRLLATGSADRTIRIWNVETGEVKYVIAAQRDGIDSLAFSPDGRTIASGGETGTIVFSHVETGRLLLDIKIGSRKVHCLQFSPDGKTLAATVSYQGVTLLHTPRTKTNNLSQPGQAQPLLEFPRKNDEIESTPPADLPLASNTNDTIADFIGLGLLPGDFSDSYADEISTDGSSVIGYCVDRGRKRHYFRWKQDTGLRELTGYRVYLCGLDGAGSILCGSSYSSGIKRATIWQSPSEFRFLTQPAERFQRSECEAASADGSILVGWYKNSSNSRRALRWSFGGIEVLASTTPGVEAIAKTISASGEIIVGMEWTPGTDYNSKESRIWPVRWTSSGVERLPGFDPAYNWFVNDTSSDGSVVVGTCWLVGTTGPSIPPTESRAFLWKNGTTTLLGDRSGMNIKKSRASSISDDGRIVVGISKSEKKSFAFVWDSANGLRSIESVLHRYDVFPLNWRIHDAKSVSGDGQTIVGWGYRNNGHKEAWLARLPKQAFAPSVEADFSK